MEKLKMRRDGNGNVVRSTGDYTITTFWQTVPKNEHVGWMSGEKRERAFLVQYKGKKIDRPGTLADAIHAIKYHEANL